MYVDKTDLVCQLTRGKIYFLIRPRRFGKSLLVSTLKNYFLGKKDLFKGLKIYALEKDWKTYPVFHLDFNGQNFSDQTALDKTLENFLVTYEDVYCVGDPNRRDIGRLVNTVLDMAERMAKRHMPMTMKDWAKRIDIILEAGGDEVLMDAGKVTAEFAKDFAEAEFEKYRVIQDKLFRSDFDKFNDGDDDLPMLPFDE